MHNIAEYLKGKKKQVQLYATTKPDIVFEHNGKKYAVEIETGVSYRNYKKQLLEKVKQLKKNYGDRWIFVVTNEKIAPKYNTLGKTFTRTNFLKQFEKWIKKT